MKKLSILFMRFFHIADEKEGENFFFQFSLWDSAFWLQHLQQHNSNFQFSLWDSLAFETRSNAGNYFQFSLWDSAIYCVFNWNQINSPFNSLYEIQNGKNPGKLGFLALSILFMRFKKEIVLNIPKVIFFQFSLWDSVRWFNMATETWIVFQFSLWDSPRSSFA